MKTLHLTLTRKWFDMIASGEKKEEYREIKRYWEDRLNEDQNGNFHEVVEFRNGYHREARKMKFKIDEIGYGCGRQEWGAKPGQNYFVIRLGERLL